MSFPDTITKYAFGQQSDPCGDDCVARICSRQLDCGCPLSDGALQRGIAGRHQLRCSVDDRFLCIARTTPLIGSGDLVSSGAFALKQELDDLCNVSFAPAGVHCVAIGPKRRLGHWRGDAERSCGVIDDRQILGGA